MKLPIRVSFDLATKVRVVITCKTIMDRDIDNEVINPVPVELVNCDLEVPYPNAQKLMELISEYVCSHPEGIKIYDSMGREILNLETGELYAEEEKKDG
ncbi:hypothetical protein ACFLXD_05360 [Chloroflexota bacterium]